MLECKEACKEETEICKDNNLVQCFIRLIIDKMQKGKVKKNNFFRQNSKKFINKKKNYFKENETKNLHY